METEEKKEKECLFNKPPWNKIKTFDWWVKLISSIGSVGAIVAIFFLWCSIKEIQKQTELEYKGYVVMKLDTVRLPINTQELTLVYHYESISRVPLFSIYTYRLNLFSQKREVDFSKWIRDIRPKMELSEAGWRPLSHMNPTRETYPRNPRLIQADSIFYSLPESQRVGSVQTFFYHVIFKYRDWLSDEYWAYACWKFSRHCTGKKGDLLYFDYIQEEIDYEVWEAKPRDDIPDTLDLPPRLKGLSQMVCGVLYG